MSMITYLIILLPILYQLASPLPGLSLGELLLIPFMLCRIIKQISRSRLKIKIPKGLVAFYFIPVLTTVFAMINPFFRIEDAITVMVRIVFYFLLILLAEDCLNFGKVINTYFVVAFICALYLYAQVIAHRIIGFDLPIPANYNRWLMSKMAITDTAKYYSHFGFRPASLFTEPSYYADYTMPVIFIILFKKNLDVFSKRLSSASRIVYAMLFSLPMLLSTSSLGVVYLCIAWGLFVFSNCSHMKTPKNMKAFMVIALAVFTVYVVQSEVFAVTIRRITSGSSIGARFYRGFILYGKTNFFQKVFGVGLNNIGNFVRYYGITTVFDEANLNYTVTLTNRLVATGLIGTIALIYFWIAQFIKKSNAGKAMLLAILISFLFANGEYTFGFPFFFILLNQIDQSEAANRF